MTRLIRKLMMVLMVPDGLAATERRSVPSSFATSWCCHVKHGEFLFTDVPLVPVAFPQNVYTFWISTPSLSYTSCNSRVMCTQLIQPSFSIHSICCLFFPTFFFLLPPSPLKRILILRCLSCPKRNHHETHVDVLFFLFETPDPWQLHYVMVCGGVTAPNEKYWYLDRDT